MRPSSFVGFMVGFSVYMMSETSAQHVTQPPVVAPTVDHDDHDDPLVPRLPTMAPTLGG